MFYCVHFIFTVFILYLTYYCLLFQIFLPFCRQNHWVCFAVDFRSKTMVYFNSLSLKSWPEERKMLEYMWPRIIMSMMLLYGEYICGDKADRYEGLFTVKFAPCLLQPNLNWCALSTLMFMEYWDGKIPRNIAEEMQSLDIMNGMRRVVLQDILFSSVMKGLDL